MNFKLAGFSVEMQPAIMKWGFEDLGDDPASHRWRAWWALDDISSETGGIELRAYPVIKVNSSSVWIDEWAHRDWMYGEGEPYRDWSSCSSGIVKKRLCHNDARAAWAKPTQDQAIESLAIRLCKWTANMRRERERAANAARALEKLRPDFADFAKMAMENLT